MNLNFTKFFALLIGTAMSVATMAQPCSNLFFSEYVEGTSGLDKAVEIYNASNQPIDLAEISVRRYSNGNTGTGAVIALSGILQPYETFVIANGGADTSIANHADLLSGSLSFNGNDALALINDTTGDTLDIFGVIGQDPTAVLGWTDPLGNNWSADITLRRKFNIEEGVYSNPANFDPSMEWDSIGVDVFGGLGTHDNSCQNTFSFGPCQNPFFSEYVDGSIQNKALEIYNPTSDTVWLDSMDVQIFNNGSSVPVNSISLDTHFIPPFGKFVLVHDVADASLLATASMVHPDVEFDGNDAIALTKDNNILDLIGEIGIDPGANGWLSSNGTIWTTDNTLKRHFQIDMGQNSASPFIPDMEWDSLGLDSIGDLGFHENVCVPVPGGPCTWPFFSEYIEGTSFNKAIELFNPSPDTLWLDSFEIDIYNNGGTTPTSTISLIGHFIEPHETFVIAHGSADPNIVNLADLTFSIGFNGNDAIALMLDDTVYVDIIGKIGEDPGSGWIGSSNGQVWTQDFTLVRQFQVDKGQGDTSLITFDPSIEWDQMPIDDFSDLGKHSNVCSDTCNVIVNFTVWDETAPGKNDGQIQSFPLNGVAPFSFLWTTGDTTLNLDSLAPGNYGVTVTDATGCVKVDSFVINPANCLLTVSGNTTDASDSSVADGTVSIFVNNFVGPFTISWNNGDTTLFVDSLAWGTYTVTVTDSAGCQVSDTFEVGVESNCILFIDSINIINNLCADDTLGQIDVFATHIDSILYIQDFQGGIPNDFTIWNFDSLTPSTSVAFVNDAWVSIEDPNFPGSGDSIAVSTSWYQETPSIANDWMVTPPITLTNNNILRWLASASSATWPDGYEVRISTTTPDTNAFFSNPAIFAVPAENAFWTEHIIDISAYAGQTVYFAFRNNSNFQELLYIDEIVVAQKSLTSITYNWSNGDTTSQIGNLATGTYNLQISAGNGCTLDTNITIDSPDSLWINFTVQDETPSGASNGAISAAANGGVGPYQYLWFNNDTTQTVSGLSQGWYSLLISDANNCLFLDSAFVDTADACDLLDVQAWSTPQIVPGQADGSAWAQGTISSIFEDFNFILDSSVFAGIEGANQNADCGAISGLALHFDGDTARYLETIDLNTSLGGVLEFGLTIGDGVAPCDGAEAGEDVILEFSTNSGATWDTLNIYDESAFGGVWIDVQEQLPSNAQTSSTRFRWSQLAWTGSGFDNWALDDIELKLNNPLITYAWSNGATGDSITGLAPGTYVVTATDGNCTAVDTVEVDPFTCNVNISFAVVHEQSVGANDGQATAQLNNGFGSVTYNWSNGQTGAIATGLAPGIYQVWASDTAGCVDSAEVEILPVLCSFNLDSIIAVDPLCPGNANGLAGLDVTQNLRIFEERFNHGIPSTWTLIDNDGFTPAASVSFVDDAWVTTEDYAAPGSGDSVATSTSWYSAGQQADDWLISPAINLTANSDLFWRASASSGTFPDGYEVRISTSGTAIADFLANPALLVIPAENDFWTFRKVDLAAMGYTNQTVHIAFVNNSTFDELLFIDDVLVTDKAAGNLTYTWSNGGNTSTISNLSAGTYDVTVSANNGCSFDTSVVLVDPIALTNNLTVQNEAPIGAGNGSATANPSGGTAPYTYQWFFGSTAQSISNLSPGTYILTVTDANGCFVVDTAVVGSDSSCVIPIDSIDIRDVLCNGDSTGWIQIFSSTDTAQGYDVLYQDDFNLGLDTNLWLVIDNDGLTSASGLIGGSWEALNFGGEDYAASTSWYTPAGASSDWLLSPLLPLVGGDVIYWEGISLSATWLDGYDVYILDDTLLVGPIYSTSGESANGTPHALNLNNFGYGAGDTISIVYHHNAFDKYILALDNFAWLAPAQSNLSYVWNNGDTTSTIVGLSAGTYSVTISDGNGCSVDTTVVVSEPPAISLTMGSTDESGAGIGDGSAWVIATGGVPPYSYSWTNNPSISDSITGLSTGWHYVAVADDNGCTIEDSVFVGLDTTCNLAIDSVDIGTIACHGDSTGWIQIHSSSDTTAAFDLFFSEDFEQGFGANGWFVADLDSNVSAIPSTIGSMWDTLSLGGSNTFAASTSWYTPPGYSADWLESPGLILQGGDLISWEGYSVDSTWRDGYEVYVAHQGQLTQVFSTGGESWDGAFHLVDLSSHGFGVGDTVSIVFWHNALDKVILLIDNFQWFAPAASNLSYAWSTGDTTSSVFGLPAGSYSVTITDDQGCTVDTTVTITEPSPLTASTISTNETSAGAGDGTAQVIANGATPPYTYGWSNAGITSSLDSLNPGTYYVTVTDDNGCSVEDSVIIGTDSIPCTLTVSATATDETSAGAGDGTATAVASNGTTPYSYVWSNGASGASISGLVPGTYVVFASDTNGCLATDTVIVNQGPCNLMVSISTTDESVQGANDGSALATPLNGIAPYTYSWNNGATTQNISNLAPGTYTVTTTDSLGCQSVDTATINPGIPCTVGVTVSGTDETSFGANDGTALATPTPGVSPYTFIWNNGATTQGIVNLAPGWYYVTVTDSIGCSISDSIEIEAADPCVGFASSMQSTDETVAGANDGTALVVLFGGNAPFTYAWSNGATSQGIVGLAPGTYIVSVTDTFGCSVIDTAVIDTGSSCNVFANISSSDETSAGANDGSAIANPTGGTAPYNYVWSNAATSAAITNLAPGTYFVTITDSLGCSIVDSAVVQSGPCLLTVVATGTDESVPGASDGTATASASNGIAPYSYTWNNGATTQIITGLPAGTYVVTATDSVGCTAIDTIVIGVANPCNVSISLSSTNETVAGANDGTATTVVSGGTPSYSYSWSNGATTANITNLAPGIYTVVVTDSLGCTATDSTIVNPANCAVQVAATSTDETAAGANDGTASATATGGINPYTYSWSNGATGANITNLAPGTYVVIATDSAGCSASDTVVINPFGGCNLSVITTSTDETAPGANDGTALALPLQGTPPMTYAWSNGGTTQGIVGLAPGTYFVTVTDSLGCTASDTVVIDSAVVNCNMAIAINGTDESFPGASDGVAIAIPANGTAPYAYNWSNAGTTQLISGLAPGTYYVTVTDSLGCTATDSVVIGTLNPCNNFILTINSTDETTPGANDGTALAVTAGGQAPINYVWSNGGSTQLISGLAPGWYTVTATDSLGCTAIDSVLIDSAAACNVSLLVLSTDETAPGANDGTAIASPSGGATPYTFVWSNASTSQFIGNLAPGVYYVTVTDSLGCTATDSAVINAAINCTLTLSTTGTDETSVGQNDGTATAIGANGVLPYIYNWSNGATSQSISGLAPGTYYVTVTDSLGCTASDSVIVNFGACLLSAATTSTDETAAGANDGTATATATGGLQPVTYSWSNGATTQVITNLAPGTYTVVIMDSAGCVDSAVAIVNPFGCNLTLTTVGVDESSAGAGDGSATVTASNGVAPYTYNWSTGGTTNTINNLIPGLYTVTVTDSTGCTNIDSVTIGTTTCQISLLMSANDETLQGANDGDATAIATNGTSPYSYVWSSGQTTAIITNLAPGTYVVTVTDSLGCTASDSVVINPSTVCMVDSMYTLPSNTALNNGEACVYVIVGTAPFTYNWSTGDTTNCIDSLVPGTYYVTITDASGCTLVDSAIITGCNLIVTVSSTHETAAGANDGTVSATASGGTAPYNYLWGGLGVGASHSNVSPGNYTVVVTDATGCQATSKVTVDAFVSVAELQFLEQAKLYPNPTKDRFTLEINTDRSINVSYKIVDLLGNDITEIGLINNVFGRYTQEFNVEHLANGVYYLQMITENKVTNKRFVVN